MVANGLISYDAKFFDVVTFPDDAADETELIKKIAQELWLEEMTEQRVIGGKHG